MGCHSTEAKKQLAALAVNVTSKESAEEVPCPSRSAKRPAAFSRSATATSEAQGPPPDPDHHPRLGVLGLLLARGPRAGRGEPVIPKGTHMYLNHASESEQRDRPEREVEKIAAVLVEDAVWDGTGSSATPT
jgi:hypothetical protein